MKATLCIIGLTLLCTTLAEGTTLHLKTRKDLKKPFTGAQRNQNLETHLGKIIHNIFLEKKTTFQSVIILTMMTAHRNVALSFNLHLNSVILMTEICQYLMRALSGTVL